MISAWASLFKTTCLNSYTSVIYFRRQKLTSKVNPRTERVKLFIMPRTLKTYRYSNESERTDYNIYDDFKLEKKRDKG